MCMCMCLYMFIIAHDTRKGIMGGKEVIVKKWGHRENNRIHIIRTIICINNE